MGLPNIGPVELIIVLVIALLILGPGKLPEVGSAFGKTIREFRKASSDITDSTIVDDRRPSEPPTAAPLPAPSTPDPSPARRHRSLTHRARPPATPADPVADRRLTGRRPRARAAP